MPFDLKQLEDSKKWIFTEQDDFSIIIKEFDIIHNFSPLINTSNQIARISLGIPKKYLNVNDELIPEYLAKQGTIKGIGQNITPEMLESIHPLTIKKWKIRRDNLFHQEIDAYRHIFESAYFTYKYGEDNARFLNYWHEVQGIPNRDPFVSHNMDFWNNEIGYSIGKYMKDNNLSLLDLPDLVTSIMNTDLPILDPEKAYDEGKIIYQGLGFKDGIGLKTDDLVGAKIQAQTLRQIDIDWYSSDQLLHQSTDFFENILGLSANALGNAVDKITDIYDNFKKAFLTISPLILDLDGDGVETLSINNGINFDHNADGFSELTGWAGKDDGLLVLDINDNGLIDSGRELFGEHTLLSNGEEASGGFEALAELDTNLDGKIDANDTQFSDLKIWIDANSDGITDSGELHTLGELNIESISLNFENVNKEDAEGNLISQAGSYTTTDQVTHDLSDIKFQVNNVFSQSVETLEISPEIEALAKLKAA
ncbi:MAG: hypothetical protein AB1782_01535 [Cyanobacteriota bacterium]